MSLRAQLSIVLCSLLAVLGLWTCLVQSSNHERAEGLRGVIMERSPADWIDEQIADIDAVRDAS